MINLNYVEKGEIYSYNFGKNPYASRNGIYPVLILQGDDFNEHCPTTIVAPIMPARYNGYLPSHIHLDEGYGLSGTNIILLDQLFTINQKDLLDYIGYIDDEYTNRVIWNALKKTMGMWDYTKNNSKDVYTICPRCLSNLRNDPTARVSRLDPFQTEKDSCTLCNRGYGFDYVISRKKEGHRHV